MSTSNSPITISSSDSGTPNKTLTIRARKASTKNKPKNTEDCCFNISGSIKNVFSKSDQTSSDTDSSSSSKKRKPSRNLKSRPLENKLRRKRSQISTVTNACDQKVNVIKNTNKRRVFKSFRKIDKTNENKRFQKMLLSDVQSSSSSSSIDNDSLDSVRKMSGRRKRIDLYETQLYTSDSSSTDQYLFNTNLSTPIRKTKNREYALKTKIPSKSVSNVPRQIPDFSLMYENLKKKMKSYKRKPKNEELDTSASDIDIVVRGAGQDKCESLNLSTACNVGVLSDSSSSLPDLEVEVIKPHVYEIETLSSPNSIPSPVQEQEPDIFVECIAPPSLPDMDNQTNQRSKNESSISIIDINNQTDEESKNESNINLLDTDNQTNEGSNNESSIKVPDMDNQTNEGSNNKSSIRVPDMDNQTNQGSKNESSINVLDINNQTNEESKNESSINLLDTDNQTNEGSNNDSSIKVPDMDNQTNEESNNESSIRVPDMKNQTNQISKNQSVNNTVHLPDLPNINLLNIWLQDLECDSSNQIKEKGEKMLLSDAKTIDFLAAWIKQQPVQQSPNKLYNCVIEVNHLLHKYFNGNI